MDPWANRSNEEMAPLLMNAEGLLEFYEPFARIFLGSPCDFAGGTRARRGARWLLGLLSGSFVFVG
jgi:hypothetical protein